MIINEDRLLSLAQKIYNRVKDYFDERRSTKERIRYVEQELLTHRWLMCYEFSDKDALAAATQAVKEG